MPQTPLHERQALSLFRFKPRLGESVIDAAQTAGNSSSDFCELMNGFHF